MVPVARVSAVSTPRKPTAPTPVLLSLTHNPDRYEERQTHDVGRSKERYQQVVMDTVNQHTRREQQPRVSSCPTQEIREFLTSCQTKREVEVWQVLPTSANPAELEVYKWAADSWLTVDHARLILSPKESKDPSHDCGVVDFEGIMEPETASTFLPAESPFLQEVAALGPEARQRAIILQLRPPNTSGQTTLCIMHPSPAARAQFQNALHFLWLNSATKR
mmetsp:Transcript_55061/g.120769  ORF Transcript_55061/g.120769 Transcript_55061/m.120769 type:complete len:220 (+) Transcript_55061:2-661(+)